MVVKDGGAQTAASAAHPTADERNEVWSIYLTLLKSANSQLLDAGEDVQRQLRWQLEAVLVAVAERFAGARQERGMSAPGLSTTIGRERAAAGLHPSQSLAAAALIFEAALPLVAKWAASDDPGHAEQSAAVALNAEILSRMSQAASGYVNFLINKIHESGQLERRALSRGLHDVVAADVAVALQQLELHDLYRTDDAERAARKLDDARLTLIQAVADIRKMSEFLRVDVSEQGLEAALQQAVDAASPSIERSLVIDGFIDDIAPAYRQEIFLIVREAVRNANAHAGASVIRVQLRRSASFLEILVADDGAGFDHATVMQSAQHLGLDSMAERAEILAASFPLRSQSGVGTQLRLAVPLTEGGQRS